MRGLFTAGIIDVMMENDIWPEGLIGVSAGAAFGCNYKSRQPGRAIRYNKRFARDKRHIMYNQELVYVYEAETAGRCLVIRPDEPLPIGHISHDPDEMQRVYDIGRDMGNRYLNDLKAFYA